MKIGFPLTGLNLNTIIQKKAPGICTFYG